MGGEEGAGKHLRSPFLAASGLWRSSLSLLLSAKVESVLSESAPSKFNFEISGCPIVAGTLVGAWTGWIVSSSI